MYEVETDVERGVLRLSYHDHVTVEEVRNCRLEVEKSVAKLGSGFLVFTDLSGLERMDFECTSEIRGIMEFLKANGVGRVIRVVPDPSKDIGFSILSYFHYGATVRIQTFESFEEAVEQI